MAWSPSGRRLLLSSSAGRYAVVETETLVLRELTLPWQLIGVTWIDESNALVAAREGVFRVQVDAGSYVPLPARSDELRSRPSMLPDGRRYLYLRGQERERDLCVGSVDDVATRCLAKTARFAYGRGRVLLLVDLDGRLFGQVFDPQAAELSGTRELLAAIPVNTANDPGFLNSATVSRDGVIAFAPERPSPRSELTWFDRAGRRLEQASAAVPALNFHVSRDRRLAAVTTPIGTDRGVYVLDLARGVRTKIADDRANDVLMSPDGRFIAYVSNGALQIQSASGGPARTVFSPEIPRVLTIEDWVADGQSIIGQLAFGQDREILEIPTDGAAAPKRIALGSEGSDEAHLSSDGRWLAFSAVLSDRSEVFVTAVPSTGARVQVSVAGGVSPRWRDDGRELYFLDPNGVLHAAAVSDHAGEPRPARPTGLFTFPFQSPSAALDHFEPGPAGKSFLLRVPVAQPDPRTVLLVNWF